VIAFFDASALIYLLEGREPFAGRVRAELAAIERAHAGVRAAVSIRSGNARNCMRTFRDEVWF